MMSSPSYSYKFYWLEAIVQLISANRTEVTYDEIINKMIVNAWFPVQEYHIHLSGIYGEGEVKDNLEKAVSRLFKLSDLPSNADEIQIINKLNEFSDDKELHFYKTELTKNVPYKALSGFANKGTEKIDLNSSAGRMIAYYNRLSGAEILLPYTFNDEKSLKKVVSFNDGWIQMIQDNTVSILGWIKYEKVKWLQNNNPEVPGIVYKLTQEDEKARKLENVRKLWDAILEIRPVKNVFMEGDINRESYAVDHFIPRNFVMNDELWNLMPIAAKGFTFNEGLVENYYLSLKSKPFVILAGTSGTGKTRLVRLFAEAIGATSQNGRYKLVSVRPDWSDSSDLFGHVNLNDKFIPGAIIDFVKQAELDSRNPYFLCLDEMNLARVEYYLSDILSIIETREYVDGKVTTDPLITENYYGADITAKGKYGVVRIPENLYIIGTVNMDETTFPFSRKVLDRANTIEFSTVELLANFDSTQGEVKAIFADNTFMKADYVFFNQCASDKDFVEDVCIELQDINKILEKANAHVGYRVRDEIVFYMLNNKNAGNLLTRNQAFDHEIMQKILPRIQGSSASVKIMLCELFKYCAGDYESYQTESDDVSAKMMAAANKETCKYKESAKKIAFMVRRFEEDGFTAYWL